MPPEQLDGLVAPIALYADPLVAQVLAAATYPLEIVEADRWLQANPNLNGTALTDAARNQSWDPSVQALVVFPTVIQMMDKNLRWTTDLGNAFLAQEQDVMDAIQRQRQNAAHSGKLVSNAEQSVQTSSENNRPVISIEPAQPEFIYVPVYDPVNVWGPVYNPYPTFWYPPRPSYGTVIAGGGFGFFVGVAVGRQFHNWGGWNNWGWRPGWRNRTVIVNNNFYIRNNYRTPNNYRRDGNSNWTHNPQHRAGVPYPNRGVANHFGGGLSRDRRPIAQPGARIHSNPQSIRDVRPNTLPAREARPNPQPARDARPNQQPDRMRDRSGVGNADRTRTETHRGDSNAGSRGATAARPAPATPAVQQPRPAPNVQSRPAERPAQSYQAPAARSERESGRSTERRER
jgi:hypothetical protein